MVMLVSDPILCVCCVCVFCFFQAEDGIRDLVRSRGLGDVYKRQRLSQLSEDPVARCHRGLDGVAAPPRGAMQQVGDFDRRPVVAAEFLTDGALSLIHI